MFEVIVKVLEKAIELISLREKNNRDFFETIIDPLFKEFEKVAESYFLMFSQSSPSIAELKSIRDGYILARIKITETVDAYKKSIKDEDTLEFLESIQYFFYGQNRRAEKAIGAGGEAYIDYLSHRNGSNDEEDTLEMLESTRKRIHESWGNTVRCYSVLKMKYTRPIGGKT